MVAKHHGVPFYIAAPFTSFDLSLASGKEIVIEERPAKELTYIQNVQVRHASGQAMIYRIFVFGGCRYITTTTG